MIDRINLGRREGESPDEYHNRLLAISSAQIGLIFAYETEKKLDRSRLSQEAALEMMEEAGENAEEKMREVILKLHEEVEHYKSMHPDYAKREPIKSKLRDISTLL